MTITNQKLEATETTLKALSSTVEELTSSLSKTRNCLSKTMGIIAKSQSHCTEKGDEEILTRKYFEKLKCSWTSSRELKSSQQKTVKSLANSTHTKYLSFGFQKLKNNSDIKRRQERQTQKENQVSFQNWTQNT